ncbi:hypothetical protein SpCBS45565_g02498 [Spizellomyces sp. 'palustris']|nr:hypothetical protein SpCBS45565_g02498 [Spizellomyces sp. 'palustris']
MKRKRDPLLDLADSVEGSGEHPSQSDESEDSNNEDPSSRSGQASASNRSRGEVFPAHLALPALPASLETHSHKELVGFIRRYHSLLKHHTSRLSALDSHLHCAICTSYFVGPYNLECGHMFCYNCILAWFNNLQQNSRPKRCPTCRADTTCRPRYERTVSRLVEDYLTVVNDEESRNILQSIKALRDSHAALPNQPFHEHFPNDGGDRVLPDVDDGVVRCSRCNWEVLNGTCQGCGNVYRDARESEEEEELEDVEYFDNPPGWTDSESDLSFVVDDGDGLELDGGPHFPDDYEGFSARYDDSDYYDSDYGLSGLNDMFEGFSDTDMLGGDNGCPWHDEGSISPDSDYNISRNTIDSSDYDDSDSSFDGMFGDSPDTDASGGDGKDAHVRRIPPIRNSPPMSASESEHLTGSDDQSQDDAFEDDPIGRRRRNGRSLPILDSESDDENQKRQFDHHHTDQSHDVRRHRTAPGGCTDDDDAWPVIKDEEKSGDLEENEKVRRSAKLDRASKRKGKHVASNANKNGKTESQFDCKEEVDIPGTSEAHRQRNDKKSKNKRKLHHVSDDEHRLSEVGARQGTESSGAALDPERKKRRKKKKRKSNTK